MPNEHKGLNELELGPDLQELTRLMRQSMGRMSSEQSLSGELAFLERIAAKRRKRPGWLAPAAALLAISAAAAALLVPHRAESAVLSYVVENHGASENSSLDVGTGPPQTARFSDGTEVRVNEGAQARIRLVTSRGAEIALFRGSLHAAVVHAAASEWRFDAGPFVVHVTGTAFGLAWDPEHDRFDLRLERGSVTVSGPVINAQIPVLAGQWLTIRPHSNEVFIRDLAGASNEESEHESELQPSAPATEAGLQPSAPATESSAASATGLTPSAARPTPQTDHTWARDLLDGKADHIVDDALRRGLDRCLNDSSPRELSALADAARYTRRNDVARRALLAERRRFAGSRTGLDAALLLGRLAEAEENYGQALTWFDAYLVEAPSGAYASEALGRKMAVLRHSSSAAAASGIAEQYLGKYPDGSYAAAARAILKSQ